MAKKILHHDRRIISKKDISTGNLIPGMMISFRYPGNDISDKNPLVLFLAIEKSKGLMHCVNLNYLYERDLQNLFENISKKIPVKISEGSTSHIQFTKDIKPRQLYETIIKPKLLNTNRTADCYRTYKLSNIKGIKLVGYKLDVIEKQIRKQTGLSKHKLKTSELYKAIEEQNINTETDNVRVETQEEIRKDIRK